MKQTARIISTYASDVSGVCSALFELGGMTVMHDASGCNSTYNTHDEPRWYDCDSMVFISALTETQAIMGDDEKLIKDVCETAYAMHPSFIALAGTPIPMMTGTDFDAIASAIHERTGLPCFGFKTNGMHTYINGASAAFAAVCEELVEQCPKTPKLSANIIGATPLDLSVNATLSSILSGVSGAGFEIVCCMAMGSTLSQIRRASSASVNLVISACGVEAAKILKKRFGTPYVVGFPTGSFAQKVYSDMKTAATTGECIVSYSDRKSQASDSGIIIGETVFACSAAYASASYSAVCPTEAADEILPDFALRARDECELIPIIDRAQAVAADPLYKPICVGKRFINIPHEAFSGRIFRSEIPDLTTINL